MSEVRLRECSAEVLKPFECDADGAPRARIAVESGMSVTCYSLVLGARNTPGARRRFSRRDDQLIRDITLRHFPDGFTILNADGGWFDPARGRFVEEESRQILVCPSRRGQLHRWCEDLATALHQHELLVMEVGRAVSFRPRRGGAVRKQLASK